MSVAEKILAVMKRVTFVERDIDMGDYWTLSDEKVTSAVRAACIEEGLIIVPIEIEVQAKDIIVATIKYRIQADDGINVSMSGSGETVGAAITNAHKYMLLQVFNIPNGTERMIDGKKPEGRRGGALFKALKKMCPDEQMLNRIAQNMFQKDIADLTDDELQQVGNKIDELKGR